MERDTYVTMLESDGARLAKAAEHAGLEADVWSCEPWTVRDLLRHLGFIHRWAALHVAEGRARPVDLVREVQAAGAPEGPALIDWFREGHGGLVATLRNADPAVSCWTFLEAPSPLDFWCRRQAHETAMHRADAELVNGPVTPFEPAFAADGIDELVMGFAARGRSNVHTSDRRVLQVRTTDTDDDWLIGLGPDGVDTARGAGPHDASIAGGASGLYLLLWNRSRLADTDAEATGDADLVLLWQDGVKI